jgi:trehalose 6-phosphate synthase/phosphatase
MTRSADEMTGEDASRLILVSNRLPISLARSEGKLEVKASSGGLATGLASVQSKESTIWIGWPGTRLEPAEQEALRPRFEELRVLPVDIPAREAKRFYEDFSNGVLWPILHYLIDRIPLHSRDWAAYARVNERFADAIAEIALPADQIWIHDYHLMLLPGLLRRRLPQARIGFFLHVPFPSSEVFRILPWREDLLHGLLGADLVGFHTFSYARHFTTCLLRLLGLEAGIDRLAYQGREVRIGVFPMGIDGQSFATLASDPEVEEAAAAMRAGAGGQIMLGVDRLDYTKGLLRRMLAVERLLEREPAFRGKVRFVQLAVPSREHVPEYRDYKRELEGIVGRVNGAYGTIDDAPIHYLYRSVLPPELTAMYRAADAMVVTPLRDGMNLVAKEFVASRVDGDGVLVLSELAGAASELGEALLVNPYDVDQIASAMARALTMPLEERKRRMQILRERVLSRSVQEWATGFVNALRSPGASQQAIDLRRNSQLIAAIAGKMAAAPELGLILDYDGTLVPLARRPELAPPDSGLLALLGYLAALPRTTVTLASGRIRQTMDEWFGALPIALCAEHGLWYRPAHGEWRLELEADGRIKDRVRPILEEYAARTPGALIEEKTAGLAWHYRAADPQLGALQAKELRLHLVELLAQQQYSVLAGDKVLEIRPSQATKANAVRLTTAIMGPGAIVSAFGDDRTDEDMFAALPEGALSFCVGSSPTRALYRIGGPDEARELLAQVVHMRGK